MAASNLVTQAIELGLNTHQMGGFSAEKAHEELNIPEGYTPLTMMAVGYPGSPETLPDDLRERELAPRSRKVLTEFVFEGRWAAPAPDAEA
jgi:nitroreductase